MPFASKTLSKLVTFKKQYRNLNMYLSRIVPFCLFMLSNPVLAENLNWSIAEDPNYLKIGASWDVSDKYSGTTLELQSPGIAYHGRATHEFNLVATYSSVDVDNMTFDDNGKYKRSNNSTESIGLGWRVTNSRSPISGYLQLSAIHLDADRKLARFDHPQWGTRFTFGVEYLIMDETDALKSAFFIQETSVSGLGRANQFVHEPDVFNGTNLSFGARVWI